MKIRTLLVLMAIAILLPVVLAAGIVLNQIREGEREAALRGLRETARATSLIVDREVQGRPLGWFSRDTFICPRGPWMSSSSLMAAGAAGSARGIGWWPTD